MIKIITAKKAILVTSSVFTLGLGGLGPINVLSNSIVAHADTTSRAIEIASDGTVKIINEELAKDAWFQKTLVTMGGTALKDAIKGAHQNGSMSINNFAKDMTVAGTSLIPYGGALISPMIDLLWPADGPNATKQLVDQISRIAKEEVKNYDYESLTTDLNAVKKELEIFERGLQGDVSYYNGGSIEESNRNQAQIVNAAFHKLIENCKKESHQKSELPIYTLAATAHLEFLTYMVTNGTGSNLQLDAASLQKYYKDDLGKVVTEYKDHIKELTRDGYTYGYDEDRDTAMANFFSSTSGSIAFNKAYIFAKNTYLSHGGNVENIRKIDNGCYAIVTPDTDGGILFKTGNTSGLSNDINIYVNGKFATSVTAGEQQGKTFVAPGAVGLSPDDVVTVTMTGRDGHEYVLLDGYKFKDIPKEPTSYESIAQLGTDM